MVLQGFWTLPFEGQVGKTVCWHWGCKIAAFAYFLILTFRVFVSGIYKCPGLKFEGTTMEVFQGLLSCSWM